MKDYYYILGVPRTASPDEIKKAYRKLSLKFHPDKNDGDKFFEDRFREINEAYETLFDPVRRFNYDEHFVKKATSQKNNSSSNQTPSNDPPRIILFSADKSNIAIGDIITFKWQVENATSIELKPFGAIPLIGVKAIKILGFNLDTGLEVELKTNNSVTDETVSQKIIFTKRTIVTHNNTYQTPFKPNSYKNKPDASDKKNDGITVTVTVASIMLVIALFVSHLPKSGSVERSQNIPENSINATEESDDSILQPQVQQIKPTLDSPASVAVTASQWKSNQLENGSSPFNGCFGKGKRGGRSWILFQNQNGVDAIVCLVNSLSSVIIRNEYIRAGSNFKVSNIPVGTYYIKVLYGNDWNPNLTSPCGSLGFFESDVSFSVSDGYNDTINVESVNNGYSTQYSTHTITLYPVANGNMSQRGIEANQFFNH